MVAPGALSEDIRRRLDGVLTAKGLTLEAWAEAQQGNTAEKRAAICQELQTWR